MPETVEYADPEEYRKAVKAAQSGATNKRTKRAKPDLPRGEPSAGDMHGALKRLAARGLMPRYRAGVGHDCWSTDGRSTPVRDDYHKAVRAAERMKD